MNKHFLLISYTVYEDSDDTDLIEKLERADSYELDESAWIVYTEESARWWYQQLEPLIYEDDDLIVMRIDIHEAISDEGTNADFEKWRQARLEVRP